MPLGFVGPPIARPEIDQLISEVEDALRAVAAAGSAAGAGALIGPEVLAAGVVTTLVVGIPWVLGRILYHDTELDHLLSRVKFAQAFDPDHLGARLRALRRYLRRLRARAPARTVPGDVPGPSPGQITAAQMDLLRYAVAAERAYTVGHHYSIHLPLTDAGRELALGADAVARGITALGVETARSQRVLRELVVPTLRERLEARIHDVGEVIREFRHRVLTDIVPALQRQLDRDTDRLNHVIGDVVPIIYHQLGEERAQRVDRDQALQTRLDTEHDNRLAGDLALGAAVAPLTQWFRSFGKRTTTKVDKLEDPLDQLLRSDLGWLAMLSLPPALLALIQKILIPVAGRIPDALAGFMAGAERALEAL